jgi:hypothetical protein
MNRINEWHEVTTALKRENFGREEAVLHLREAELSNPGLLEHIRAIVRGIFGGWRGYHKKQQTVSRPNNRAIARKHIT